MAAASYAAVWAYPNKTPHAGKLEVTGRGLHLKDSTPTNPDARVVPYDAITAVRFAEQPDRLADLKTLLLDLTAGPRIRVAVLGAGAGAELAALISQRLSSLAT